MAVHPCSAASGSALQPELQGASACCRACPSRVIASPDLQPVPSTPSCPGRLPSASLRGLLPQQRQLVLPHAGQPKVARGIGLSPKLSAGVQGHQGGSLGADPIAQCRGLARWAAQGTSCHQHSPFPPLPLEPWLAGGEALCLAANAPAHAFWFLSCCSQTKVFR